MLPIQNSTDFASYEEIRARSDADTAGVRETVARVLEDVRQNGDRAVLAYTQQFDGAALTQLEVAPEEMELALAEIDPELLRVLRRARDQICAYHERQKQSGFVQSDRPGIVMGQRVLPLDRVGLYIPGGTASYPSTVLMNALPAKIAGVGELIMATPPGADGRIPAPRLAAARLSGVDRVFKMGGAQAVAALAYGTKSVPRVDKITGPGNLYVATAKQLVYGLVDIDMIAGPSEILIIADDTANPAFVAADLLAQAEHDERAASILLTTSLPLAKAVQAALSKQLKSLPRAGIASASLTQNGRIVVVPTLSEAARISNAIAPEHLELCTAEPFALLGEIRHAGSIFLGSYAPEALGDYLAGPNHTLPTNGTARFSSALSVDDFVKKSSFLYYSRAALQDAAADVARFAQQEGLEAHARSATIRLEE